MRGVRGRRRARGFTLIEVLTVLAVVGILTSIAVVRTGSARGRAYRSAMQEDLRAIAIAQENYYAENRTYTSNIAQLTVDLSNGVTATINASAVGWTAQTTHPLAEGRMCALFVGSIAPLSPAVDPGVLACSGQFTSPGCGGP